MPRMTPENDGLHRSFFDLLKQKYPETGEPTLLSFEQRPPERRPAERRAVVGRRAVNGSAVNESAVIEAASLGRQSCQRVAAAACCSR